MLKLDVRAATWLATRTDAARTEAARRLDDRGAGSVEAAILIGVGAAAAIGVGSALTIPVTRKIGTWSGI